jgi:hypothetical protein
MSTARPRLFDSVRPAAPPAAVPAAPPVGRQTWPRNATRLGKRTITFYVSPEGLKQMQKFAIDRDLTLQAIMVEAVDYFCKAHSLPRIS